MWAKPMCFSPRIQIPNGQRKRSGQGSGWLEASLGKKHEAFGPKEHKQHIKHLRQEGEGSRGGNRGRLTKVSQGDVAQYIEAPLLELVGQPQQRQGAPGVPHQEQQLGPPELHVILPDVQPEQVLSHLGPGVRRGEEGLKRAAPTHHPSDKNPNSSHGKRRTIGGGSQTASSPPHLL